MDVVLRNLKEFTPHSVCTVLPPGAEATAPVAVRLDGQTILLTVPLQRGCGMVKWVNSFHSCQSNSHPDPQVIPRNESDNQTCEIRLVRRGNLFGGFTGVRAAIGQKRNDDRQPIICHQRAGRRG